MLQELGQRFVYNLGANFAIDTLGLNNFGPSDGKIMTAVKQGGLIYMIDQAEMLLLAGKPIDTDIMHILDEVTFNALTMWVMTEIDFVRTVGDVVPFDGQVQTIVVSSVAVTLIQEVGKRIENGEIPLLMPIKKLVSYVRSKL